MTEEKQPTKTQDDKAEGPSVDNSSEISKEMIKSEISKEKSAEEAGKEKKIQELEKKDEEEAKEAGKREGDRRRGRRHEPTREEIVAAWVPKTKLGKEVKTGKVKNIDEILDAGKKILEPQIVDALVDLKTDLIAVGQSKGKFGGGKRRAWRQTQRKTKEGNRPTFSAFAVVGDENGHVGIGTGKSMETLPARDKAIRKAKLNLIKIERGCAAFDCACSELHTVLFEVEGKSGSVRVKLIPAPQGTGLVVGSELKKILTMAGIHDVYSRTSGKKRTTFNLIKACIYALEKTSKEKKE